MRRYLGLRNYVANLRTLGFTEADVADGGSDRLVDALVTQGDAAAVAARLDEHLAAGADHVCVQLLGDDDAVVPALRGRGGGARPALTLTRGRRAALG